MPYYVELAQTDPEDSPTPGCGHYAGEFTDFGSATEALAVGIKYLGRPAGDLGDHFYPCCDWQRPDTIITGCVVYREDEFGNRAEDNPIQAHLKEKETA